MQNRLGKCLRTNHIEWFVNSDRIHNMQYKKNDFALKGINILDKRK